MICCQQVMDDLVRQGWTPDTATETEDLADLDMKALFKGADCERRDSLELMIPPPKRVKMKHRACKAEKANSSMKARASKLNKILASFYFISKSSLRINYS